MESLGAYLKNKRETYGLTLDDIYARTKIRHHVIEQIENNNFSVMPAPYLRSFLRTYCDMVGIEPDEAQQLIAKVGLPQKSVNTTTVSTPVSSNTETATTSKQTKHAPPKAEHSVKPLLIRGFIYAGIFLVIVVLAYEFIFKPDPGKKAQVPEKGDSSLLTVVGNTVVGLIDESVTNDSIMLELKASEQVWLTLTADGKFSRQLVLNPQEKRTWSAKEYFMLSVSNAGALEIIRNGKTLPQIGEKGEFIRSVKITKDELVTSSSSYNKQITSENQQNTSQSQQNTIIPKPKPTVEQVVPVKKPPTATPQKNTTPQSAVVQKPASQVQQKPTNQVQQKPTSQVQQKPTTTKEPAPVIKKDNVVKTPPATNAATTQTKQTNTPAKQTETTQKPKQTTKEVVVKEKTEPKKTEAKPDAKTSQKEKRQKQKRRGTLEIEEVPLRPIEQGLPTTKTPPKQIPP